MFGIYSLALTGLTSQTQKSHNPITPQPHPRYTSVSMSFLRKNYNYIPKSFLKRVPDFIDFNVYTKRNEYNEKYLYLHSLANKWKRTKISLDLHLRYLKEEALVSLDQCFFLLRSDYFELFSDQLKW